VSIRIAMSVVTRKRGTTISKPKNNYNQYRMRSTAAVQYSNNNYYVRILGIYNGPGGHNYDVT